MMTSARPPVKTCRTDLAGFTSRDMIRMSLVYVRRFHMHTSTVLEAEHFAYFRCSANSGPPVASDFAACFPNYHYQDRLGVVALPYEYGALYTGFALLACTTAFYDALRSRDGDNCLNARTKEHTMMMRNLLIAISGFVGLWFLASSPLLFGCQAASGQETDSPGSHDATLVPWTNGDVDVTSVRVLIRDGWYNMPNDLAIWKNFY